MWNLIERGVYRAAAIKAGPGQCVLSSKCKWAAGPLRARSLCFLAGKQTYQCTGHMPRAGATVVCHRHCKSRQTHVCQVGKRSIQDAFRLSMLTPVRQEGCAAHKAPIKRAPSC